MTDLITVDRVNEVLREIVDEFGEDYVYPGKDGNGRKGLGFNSDACAYTNSDGSPSCIVGHVMDRLGTPRPLDGTPDNKAPFNQRIGDRYKGPFDQDAGKRLRDVQDSQDGGMSWGEAIR